MTDKPTSKKRAPRRRPVMNETTVADLVRLVRCGMHPAEAAKAIGVNPEALKSAKRRHNDVRAQIERAEAVAEASALTVLQRAMNTGSVPAATWFLERRYPQRWARAEIRASIATVNIDQDSLAKALIEGVSIVAQRWADPNEPDVEDTEAWRMHDPTKPPPPGTVEMQRPVNMGGGIELVPEGEVGNREMQGYRHMPDHPRANQHISRS
jgi:hypothetical protein